MFGQLDNSGLSVFFVVYLSHTKTFYMIESLLNATPAQSLRAILCLYDVCRRHIWNALKCVCLGISEGVQWAGQAWRRRALPFNLSISIRSAWDIPIRSDQGGPQDGSFVCPVRSVSHRPRFLVSASGRPCGPHNWLFHLWLVQVLLEAPNPGWDGEHPSISGSGKM